jgi:hypothetical protein
MGAPDRLVEVWAAGADSQGKCGSGWIVGQSGVLSCRHVLDHYLSSVEADGLGAARGQPVVQVRRARSSMTNAWIDCTVAWRHPSLDLILLSVTPGAGQLWDPPAERSPRLATTGQRPSESVATGFPEAAVKSTGLRESDQAPGQLLPGGGARDQHGFVPFDVDASVPEDASMWEGFSGSAVFDEHARLVALVVKVHPSRQQRRLLVVLIGEAATDPGFADASASVGLDPTVEDHQAPRWRESVDPRVLTATGVPPTVTDVKDLRVFGVHRPSSGGGHSSNLDYLRRDGDEQLDTALAEARAGGRRVVLVTGDSAAGKSRSASDALRRDQAVPLSDGGLSRLATADLGWQDTVLWMDDFDKYLGRGLELGTLRRVLATTPPSWSSQPCVPVSSMHARVRLLTRPGTSSPMSPR